MKYVRYLIAALLIFITLSTIVSAISQFYPENYFSLLQMILPILLLDIILIYVYSKGTLIYVTNNNQKGRWYLILALLVIALIAFVYSFIQKTEANIARQLSIEETTKTEFYKSKLDSCRLGK